MSIDNHAAWLGEAHFCHFCDFCGTLKKMCGICVRGTTYLREIKVVLARVFPVFPIFFCIFRYENCVRKQQNIPLKLTCDVSHL